MKSFILLISLYLAIYLPLPDFKELYQIGASSGCSSTWERSKFSCLDCQKDLQDTRIHKISMSNETLSAAFVAVNDARKQIYFVFRGTVNFRNFKYDFMCLWRTPLQPFNGTMGEKVRVHPGFWKIFDSLRVGITTELGTVAQKHPDYNITLLGHSMGGALATLAAVDFTLHNASFVDRISVSTFGSPKVGNARFASAVEEMPFFSKYYRVVTHGDPVPFNPPLWLNYEHPPTQISYINGSMRLCRVGSASCLGPIRPTKLANHRKYFGISPSCPIARLEDEDYFDDQTHLIV